MQDVIRVSLQEQSVHVYIKRDNNVGLYCVKSSVLKVPMCKTMTPRYSVEKIQTVKSSFIMLSAVG